MYAQKKSGPAPNRQTVMDAGSHRKKSTEPSDLSFQDNRQASDAHKIIQGVTGKRNWTTPVRNALQRPGATSRTGQRKVGFEMEMTVPSIQGPVPGGSDALFSDPKAGFFDRLRGRGKKPSDDIKRFILNGVPYGRDMGQNEHFKLTADHNVITRKGQNVYNRLRNMGYAKDAGGSRTATSNLEYVTPAIDELQQGADSKFETLFDALKTHMEATYNLAETGFGTLPAPGGAYYTGTPNSTELLNWMGEDHYRQFLPTMAAFQGAIKDSLYIQATVGILPSAIGDLHQDFDPGGSRVGGIMSTAMQQVTAGVNTLTTNATYTNSPFIQGLSSVSKQALKGILHLTLMYLVGNALNQTNLLSSTKKNAVPFLSKMNPGLIMANARSSGLDPTQIPEELKTFIVTTLTGLPIVTVDYWTSNHGLGAGRGSERGQIVGNSVTFIRGMLSGTPVSAVNTGASRQLTEDPVPYTVSTFSEAQKGVPLEYRFISARPKPSGLETALMGIVQNVRELNTKHMHGIFKNRLISEAEE